MSWLLLPLGILLGWREWFCRKQMLAIGQPPRSAGRLAYDLCTLAAILVLLQPAVFRTPEQTRQNISLALVIDVSPSMALNSDGTSRIELARQELLVLLDSLPGARVALIPFAGEPVVQVPLTADHEALTFFLAALEPGQVTAPGSAPEEAVLLAQQLLEGLPGETAVLLISDGERTLPTPAPEPLRQIPVFGLLPGSLQPQSVPGKTLAGQPAVSRPEPLRLEQLATKTGGRLLQGSPDTLAVDSLLEQWRPGEVSAGRENLWLGLALGLLLLRYTINSNRKRQLGWLPVFGLLTLFACQQQESGLSGQSLFRQAQSQSPGNDSVARFSEAAALLHPEMRAIALHNACSDALEAGKPGLARRSCEQALLIQPDLPGTASNLSLALRQLEKMPPGAGESKQPAQPTADDEGKGFSAEQARRMIQNIRISPFAESESDRTQTVEVDVERDW